MANEAGTVRLDYERTNENHDRQDAGRCMKHIRWVKTSVDIDYDKE